MRSIASKRPSPAFFISLIALFVALGGTGYAAVTINGHSIQQHTILGSRLKSNTLTGTQVNEAKLGTVPDASHAVHSELALHAVSADNSGTAQDAKTLGGHSASSFASSKIRVYWADSAPVSQNVPGVSDVHCGRDEHAISGGGDWHTVNSGVATPTIADDGSIAQSIPEGLGDNGADAHLSGWLVRGRFPSGGQRILRAYVICSPDNA